MDKTKIGILFGGRSGEHEVSIVSAESILRALDRSKYETIQIGVTREGKWFTGRDVVSFLKGRAPDSGLSECILPADPSRKALLVFSYDGRVIQQNVDVFFPVLHGTFGEDGTMQGLFELADIPYVGAGVLGSAVGMDKITQKNLFRQENLPVTDFIWFRRREYLADPVGVQTNIEKTLGYPVFVKPSNLGSSVGITKASDRQSLAFSIETALTYDRKIIVERAVRKPRELEVAVLGNHDVIASIPGEVVPSNEFYDYDAKYVDGASVTTIPADVDAVVARHASELAIKAYHAVDCEGLARVDFLYSGETKALYISEINTIPGFTSISMYPKLFEAMGISYSELLDRLIEFALKRHEEKSELQRGYTPKRNWHSA